MWEAVFQNIAAILSAIPALTRFVTFLMMKDEIKMLIKDIKDNTEIEKSFDTTKIHKFTSRVFYFLVSWSILLLVGMLVRTLSTYLLGSERIHIYSSWFFSDLTASPIFEIVEFWYIVVTLLVGIAGNAYDSLIFTLVNCIVEHLTILRGKIENAKTVNAKLIQEIIKYHKRIISWNSTVNRILLYMISAQYMIAAFIICAIGYDTVKFYDPTKISQKIAFLISALTRIFLYNYMTENITSESTNLSDVVFNSRWVGIPIKDQRNLILIIMRCQKPLVIRTLVFTLSLTTFTKTINTAASYITLLYSVLE